MASQHQLASVPDLTNWSAATKWIETTANEVQALTRGEQVAEFAAFDGQAFAGEQSPFGRYGSREWRSFALAILAADWACYPAAADRVDFVRLLFVLDRFPQGFRVWFATIGGRTFPVGYTGWYPIEASTYDRVATGTPPLRDRAFVPLTEVAPGDYIYLFNYSLVPALKSERKSDGQRQGPASPYAERMLREYADDLGRWNPKGLAAITVSGDGSRVAERFGLAPTGTLKFMDSTELLYAGKPIR